MIFLAALAALELKTNEHHLFRGHSNIDYGLRASIERNDRDFKVEHLFIKEMTSSFPEEFQRDETILEHLVRAQHFNIPTRLLDVTWNPLVAAFFASQGDPGIDGEVIVFTINKRNVLYHDSNEISIFSNISALSYLDRISLTRAVKEHNDDEEPHEFCDNSAVQKLLALINRENPDAPSILRPKDIRATHFFKPRLSNRRIIAQSGAFAISGTHGFVEENPELLIRRIKIDAENKRGITTGLRTLNIHRSSLFPELEHAAEYIRSRIT